MIVLYVYAGSLILSLILAKLLNIKLSRLLLGAETTDFNDPSKLGFTIIFFILVNPFIAPFIALGLLLHAFFFVIGKIALSFKK